MHCPKVLTEDQRLLKDSILQTARISYEQRPEKVSEYAHPEDWKLVRVAGPISGREKIFPENSHLIARKDIGPLVASIPQIIVFSPARRAEYKLSTTDPLDFLEYE